MAREFALLPSISQIRLFLRPFIPTQGKQQAFIPGRSGSQIHSQLLNKPKPNLTSIAVTDPTSISQFTSINSIAQLYQQVTIQSQLTANLIQFMSINDKYLNG